MPAKKKPSVKTQKKKLPKQSKRKQPQQKGKEIKLSLAKLNPLPPVKDLKLEFKPTEGTAPCALFDVFNSSKAVKELGALKALFKDPDGLPTLPPSIQARAYAWRRISELQPVMNEVFVPPSDGKSACSGIIAGPSLWGSILTAQLNLILNFRKSTGDCPWDKIYPRDKSNMAKFNDKGKYILRVYHQDEWRAIVIDDRVPVDYHGKPLYPVSRNPHEVWPLLVAKAINKLYPGKAFDDTGSSVLYSLCGFLPFNKQTTDRTDPLCWHAQIMEAVADVPAPPVGGIICAKHAPGDAVVWPETMLESTLTEILPLDEAALAESASVDALVQAVAEAPKTKSKVKKSGSKGGLKRTPSHASIQDLHTEPVKTAVEEVKKEVPPELGLVDTPQDDICFSLFMVVPFVPLPLLTEEDRTRLEDDEDQSKNKNMRGKKKPKPKPKPVVKKSGKRTGSAKDDDIKAMIAESRLKEEEDRKRKEIDLAFRAEQMRRRQLMDEYQKLGDQMQVVDLLTGQVAVVGVDDIETMFQDITIVLDPTKFSTTKHTVDIYKEVKAPYATGIADVLLIPPPGSDSVDEKHSGGHGHQHASSSRDAKKSVTETDETVNSSTLPPATSTVSKPEDVALNVEEFPDKPAVASEDGEESKEAEFVPIQEEKETKYVHIIISVESYDTKAQEAAALIGDVASQEEEPESPEKKSKNKAALARKSSMADIDLAEVTTYNNAAQLEQRDYEFELVIEQFDWVSNTCDEITRIQSKKRQRTVSLFVPESDKHRLYRIKVESRCGYQLAVYSQTRFVLEDGRGSSGGEVWREGGDISSRLFEGQYAAQAPNTWFVLFKYIVDIPTNDASSTTPTTPTSARRSASTLSQAHTTPHPQDILISANLHLMDQSLAQFVILQWINNDTLDVKTCGLLETGALKLAPNENGYTLVATCNAPYALYAAKWTLSLLSNDASVLDTVAVDKIDKLEEYSDVYKPNHHLQVFRSVIATFQTYLSQVALQVSLSSPDTGFVCHIYDVDDIQYTTDHAPQPLATAMGIGQCVFPVLQVSKEQRLMIECHIDPLTQGMDIQHKKTVKWKVRLVAGSQVAVFADRTQFEEFQSIKLAWAKAKPGREKQSKLSREKFLEDMKSPVELKKQPIVTKPWAKPAFVEEVEENEKSSHDARTAAAKLHFEGMAARRELEAHEAHNDHLAREAKLKSWRASAEEESIEASNKRREYRAVQVKRGEDMAALATAIAIPFGTGEEMGGASKSKKGITPQDVDAADTLTKVGAYIANVQTKMEPLADMPEWTTSKLIQAAVTRVRKVAILSMALPIRLSSSADVREQDKEAYLIEVKIAMRLAIGVQNDEQFSSPHIRNQIVQAENFLRTSALAELREAMAEVEPDESIVANCFDEIKSLPSAPLVEADVTLLSAASALLEEYAKAELDEGGKSARKTPKGKTPKGKKGGKTKSGK